MSHEIPDKPPYTREFPDHDYPCTTTSSHPLTPFWPAYVPLNQDYVVIFERSKNAHLVVYRANFQDQTRRELDAKGPLDIKWLSFGWTTHSSSSSTGLIERKLAWGYSHKARKQAGPKPSGTCYTITLNALPSRPALLYVNANGQVILQVTINGITSQLWKIYVKTNKTTAFIPKVLYVDLYGTNIDDDQVATYERISVSS